MVTMPSRVPTSPSAGHGGAKPRPVKVGEDRAKNPVAPPTAGAAGAVLGAVCLLAVVAVTEGVHDLLYELVRGYRTSKTHACDRLGELVHGVLQRCEGRGWAWVGSWDGDCFNELFRPLLPPPGAEAVPAEPPRRASLFSRPLSEHLPARDDKQSLFPPFLAPAQTKVRHYQLRRRAYMAKLAGYASQQPVPGTQNHRFHAHVPKHVQDELHAHGLLHPTYADVEFYVRRRRPVLAAWCLTYCWHRVKAHPEDAEEDVFKAVAQRALWRDGSSSALTRSRTPSLTQPWVVDAVGGAKADAGRRASLPAPLRRWNCLLRAAVAGAAALVAAVLHPMELVYVLGERLPREAYHRALVADLGRVGHLCEGQERVATGPFLLDSRLPCGAMGASRWDAATQTLHVTAPRDDGGHRMWFCFDVVRPCDAAAPKTFTIALDDLSRQMALYRPKSGRPHRPVYSINGAPFKPIPQPAKLEDVWTDAERATRKAQQLARAAKKADRVREKGVDFGATLPRWGSGARASLPGNGAARPAARERPRSAGDTSPTHSAADADPDDDLKDEVGRAQLSFEVTFEGARSGVRGRGSVPELDDGTDIMTVAFTYPYSDRDLMLAVSEWADAHAAGDGAAAAEGRAGHLDPSELDPAIKQPPLPADDASPKTPPKRTPLCFKVEALGGVASYDGRDLPLITVTGVDLPVLHATPSAEDLSDTPPLGTPLSAPRAPTPPSPLPPGDRRASSPREGTGSPLLEPIPGIDAHGNREREYVIVTARVHAGEVPASHMAHGLVQQLLSDHPRAAKLRARYVFKVAPMLNPDGVARGGSRCDGRGVNLNRVYDSPDPDEHSPVYGVVQLMEKLKADGHRVVAYLDLHAHARRRSIFAYGNAQQKDSLRNLYSFLVGLRCPFFDYNSCNFSDASFLTQAKAGTSRVAIGLRHQIPIALTVEGHYSNGDITTYGNGLPRQTLSGPLTPATFHSLGAALAQALLDIVRDEVADRDPLPDFGNLERVRRYITQVPVPGTAKAAKPGPPPGASRKRFAY